MIEYSAQVNNMCPITKGPKHGPAPIPEEGEWVKAYKIEDISGYTHGVGWCAPQQGTCRLLCCAWQRQAALRRCCSAF